MFYRQEIRPLFNDQYRILISFQPQYAQPSAGFFIHQNPRGCWHVIYNTRDSEVKHSRCQCRHVVYNTTLCGGWPEGGGDSGGSKILF